MNKSYFVGAKRHAVSAFVAAGMLSASTPAWSAVTPVTVKIAVDLTRRDVTLTNVVTGADATIRMWTFSKPGTGGGGNAGANDPDAPFPGPLLVFREQDKVEYTFNDTCPCEPRAAEHPYAGHTIHLHGLDVPTREDGVSDTSFTILPGESWTYKIGTTSAGSYIYHCHIHTVLHQNMGMYGGIVTMPADSDDQNKPFTGSPDTFSRQYFWNIAEVDKSWHDKAAAGDFGDDDEFAYFTQYKPEYFVLANYFIDVANLDTDGTTPGRGQILAPKDGLAGKTGTTLLIRVGNLGYWAKRITLDGLKFDAVASDGKPLKDDAGALAPMTGLTSIEAGPGERYDLMVKLPAVTANTAYTAKIEFLDPYNRVVGAGGKAVMNQTINNCVADPASANAC